MVSSQSSSSSSSASGVHGLLLKLHQSLSDEDPRALALKCHDVFGVLGQECMLTSTENELGKKKKRNFYFNKNFYFFKCQNKIIG